MVTNYDSLTQKWMSELDDLTERQVLIKEHTPVTVFRTYNAVDLYLSGQDVPEYDKVRLHALRDGMYMLHDIGNQGFKTTYLKVYDAYRVHNLFGFYVGWMVHQ